MDSKACRDCGEVKSLDQFPLQKGGRFGRHPLCKPCRAAQERARYARDRERLLAQMKADPKRREAALKRQYGISRAELAAMVDRQRGACAICGVVDLLHIDHDHATGRLRGLLCRCCNMALGLMRDDADRLFVAADYLDRPR